MTNKLFNSYDEVMDTTQGHQVTAQELINRRTYINGQWENIELSPAFHTVICCDIAQILGGREKTQKSVLSSLLYSRPQHWGLSRIFLENYGKIRLAYCAGQDYPSEIRTIRAALK